MMIWNMKLSVLETIVFQSDNTTHSHISICTKSKQITSGITDKLRLENLGHRALSLSRVSIWRSVKHHILRNNTFNPTLLLGISTIPTLSTFHATETYFKACTLFPIRAQELTPFSCEYKAQLMFLICAGPLDGTTLDLYFSLICCSISRLLCVIICTLNHAPISISSNSPFPI
mmetsp:Transcript_25480/g.61253  ORF Transcript_25480/g.61253 Transcript_25480/m.61253 type:complete len:174 (+) Transcript_25480:928-1449(+)